MQNGREKNSLGELRSRRRKGFGSRRGEREAKDGAKDKKRRSNYSFGGFNERGDSTSRICFISLISPRKKLAVSSFFDFFENDYSLHDFLSRGLPHKQAANVESTLLKGGFYIIKPTKKRNNQYTSYFAAKVLLFSDICKFLSVNPCMYKNFLLPLHKISDYTTK